MSDVTYLLIVGLAYVALLMIVIAQALALNRIYKSLCWWYYIAGWTLLGGLQAFNLIALPGAILKAQAQGQLPEHLPLRFWIRIAVGFVFIGLMILAQDRNRRDLRALEGDGPLREYQKTKNATEEQVN